MSDGRITDASAVGDRHVVYSFTCKNGSQGRFVVDEHFPIGELVYLRSYEGMFYVEVVGGTKPYPIRELHRTAVEAGARPSFLPGDSGPPRQLLEEAQLEAESRGLELQVTETPAGAWVIYLRTARGTLTENVTVWRESFERLGLLT